MSEFSSRILTDTKTKAVTVTPEIASSLPNIEQAFAEVDKRFLDDPEAYLEDLEASVFRFKSSEGSEVACSLLRGSDSKSDELLVILAPFSDREPKSNADEMYEYITAGTPAGLIKKEAVSPNSWSQTTKSAVIFNLLAAVGKNIPVLTIYGPIPSHAYSYKERAKFRQGDFSPAGRLVKEAVAVAQDQLNGPGSETQIETLHMSGASLGASNAIGAAASKELSSVFRLPTVTAQELILGPKSLVDLAKRFTVGQYVGESSQIGGAGEYPKINEPALRKAIDKNGSELIGTNAGMIKGMKPTYMTGLTKPEATVQAVERLLDNNVDLLVALAENSSLTHQTPTYLPNGGEKVLKIQAEKGQKIGHLADEFVALSGLVTVLNIAGRR